MFTLKNVAFLFCLVSTIANAQPFQVTRPMQCDKVSEIFKIISDFNETPIWQGKNQDGFVSILTLNPNTKTWSIIITDGDKACLADSGEGFIINQNLNPELRQQQNRSKENKSLTDI